MSAPSCFTVTSFFFCVASKAIEKEYKTLPFPPCLSLERNNIHFLSSLDARSSPQQLRHQQSGQGERFPAAGKSAFFLCSLQKKTAAKCRRRRHRRRRRRRPFFPPLIDALHPLRCRGHCAFCSCFLTRTAHRDTHRHECTRKTSKKSGRVG